MENKEASPKKSHVHGKKYQSAKSKVEPARLYTPREALSLIRETSYTKFDPSVELHAVIRRSNLNVQVALPHSTGKTKKVVIVDDAVIAELESGKVNFDVLLATPETMPKIVKFAKLLGPRGLMPNPKNGTLVKSADAIKNFSTDTITVKTEKSAPVIHVAIGKLSMTEEKLADNLDTVIQAINPKIVVKAVVTSSMGPSVKLAIS